MKERKSALARKTLTTGLFICPLKLHLPEKVLQDQLEAAEENIYFLLRFKKIQRCEIG